MIREYSRTFQQLLENLSISQLDMSKQMRHDGGIGQDAVIGLCNPYSKVTCFILYLYSMELGNPPLYIEANRVARDQDYSHLKELGPFLKALCHIIFWSEQFKRPSDKVTPGKEISKTGQNIEGSFLLFRGAQMKTTWLKPYVDNIGK